MQSKQPKQNNEESEVVNEINLDSIPQPQLTGHMWLQRGTLLTCESCPFSHASYIPPDYQLYGIDDNGYPLIRKIEVKGL
jgi:hypothetical protein